MEEKDLEKNITENNNENINQEITKDNEIIEPVIETKKEIETKIENNKESNQVIENKEIKEPEKVIIKKESKFKTKLKLFIAKKAFLVIIIIVLILLLVLSFSSNVFFQTKTTKLGLENVGKLVTQVCNTVVVQDTKVNKQIFDITIPFSESRQIFSLDFEVDAYVDFDKIKMDTDTKNKKITIILPKSQVNNINKKDDSLLIYLDEGSLFSRIDLKINAEAELKMKEQAKNDCIKNNLLTAADDNAKRLIDSLIKTNKTLRDYNVEFKYIEG